MFDKRMNLKIPVCMKKLHLVLLLSIIFFALVSPVAGYAQNVAINADASLPNSSAMLDVKSTNKGLLIPRVALTGTGDITTIPSPPTSLMVYNNATAGAGTTAVVPGYYYWDGSWVRLVAQKSGGVNYQDFYALMPSDNPSTIPVMGAISFPQTAISNSIITRNSASLFNLPDIGTYEVNFQASITETAQLGIFLNGSLLSSSVAGRATEFNQIVGTSLVTTTTVNSTLSINNTSFFSIRLTPFADGNYPVSAHLIIKKLN